ncbi:hypothetical protein [Burkholderia cepacia]|uniref:hypothetical protein n=1 Tax=Burkholderia cepacia TaxID=292 RepID=UPI0026DFBDB7|nr:hypothetical protein [Burkholderia cepacia]MDO5940610.1 hypothetical protein [Burkholderia cepacia]
MRTRCPGCGATLSLDALIAHEAAREALTVVFKMSGQLGSALIRYLALFRPETRELTMDRVAKLLTELLPDLQAQRISRHGHLHDAPVEAWIWAADQAIAARDAGRLTLPLKSHGWLYEVISCWQPQSGPLTVAAEEPRQPAKAPSRTLSAIAALEDRARG